MPKDLTMADVLAARQVQNIKETARKTSQLFLDALSSRIIDDLREVALDLEREDIQAAKAGIATIIASL